MSEATLTHKDLADRLKVSETTIKSYRRKFPGCIPVASQGKPIRFPAVVADVTLRIRDLFELGMSVEEVRLRLADEFSWVSPKAESAKKGGGEKAEVNLELTQGVSNMAKSMVAMAQQQKAILSRMQGIEGMLEDLGIQGTVDAGAMRQTAAKSAREKEELLEAHLGKLDATTQELAHTVASLAQDLGKFLGRREQVAAEWRNSGGINSEEAQAAHEQAAHIAQEPTGAKVIPLRQEPVSPPSAEPAQMKNRPTEPPKNFLTLPLVVRTGQGQYVSAGGRGRGRFCINDLKAMLAYGFTPPHHFVLSWEQHGQGWWLNLEQASATESDTARAHTLLLMELPTQRGSSVVEILQLKNNGEAVHPAEICTVIDSFGE